MRFIHIIYFSQYFELKRSGRDPQKGRVNGTLLSAVIIILNIASLFILLYKLAPHSGVIQWFRHTVGSYSGSGKALGRLIASILLLSTGGLLWFTIGSPKQYNKIAERYLELPEELQQKTVKQALYIFLFSFALFLILLFIP